MYKMSFIKIVSAEQAKIAYNYKITYAAQHYDDKNHYRSKLRLDVCMQLWNLYCYTKHTDF
jgi:hypothetical protein